MLISDDEYIIFKNWMREYIDRNCIMRLGKDNWPEIDGREIKYEIDGKLPGSKYTWQFYLRRGCFDFNFLSLLSQMFIYKVEREIGHFNFQLSGLETAATPMLSAIPLVARGYDIELNAFVVKKEQKTYGIKNWIEGRPNTKLPVMIIDDLCSTSRAMAQAKKVLEDHNLEVLKHVFTIVNKWSKYSDNDIHKNYTKTIPDTKVIHLFDCDSWNLYSENEDE